MKRLELKKVVVETILNALNEEDVDFEYQSGLTLGKNDKLKGVTRQLDSKHLPAAFIKGYQAANKQNKWQTFNDRVTNWMSQVGSSRLR